MFWLLGARNNLYLGNRRDPNNTEDDFTAKFVLCMTTIWIIFVTSNGRWNKYENLRRWIHLKKCMRGSYGTNIYMREQDTRWMINFILILYVERFQIQNNYVKNIEWKSVHVEFWSNYYEPQFQLITPLCNENNTTDRLTSSTTIHHTTTTSSS